MFGRIEKFHNKNHMHSSLRTDFPKIFCKVKLKKPNGAAVRQFKCEDKLYFLVILIRANSKSWVLPRPLDQAGEIPELDWLRKRFSKKYPNKMEFQIMIFDKLEMSKKRQFLLYIGGVCAAGLIPSFYGVIRNNIRRDISNLQKEYASLKDVQLRRTTFEKQRLIIKDANFSNNLESLVCENTTFLNCNFESKITIRFTQLSNVSFDECKFNAAKISGGAWRNVVITNSSARGEFFIVAGKGSRDVYFENCDFVGPAAEAGSYEANNFGTVGSLGSASFNNCHLKYATIGGHTSLVIQNSVLHTINAHSMRGNGLLHLNKVNMRHHIIFSSGTFSEVIIKDCHFGLMDCERLQAETLTMKNCSGCFVGKFMEISSATFRDCNFDAHSSQAQNVAAFDCAGSRIDILILDNLTFGGVSNFLNLGGYKNPIYNKENSDLEQYKISSYKKLSISNMFLRSAYLGHLYAEELILRKSKIDNSYFGNSRFKKVLFSDVKLAGNVDFEFAQIDEFTEEKLVRSLGLNIESDIRKLLHN
jgi:uncharacterized protein YjbI with pentapeptide repeats